MKTNKFFWVLMLFAATTITFSCGKDDPKPDPVDDGNRETTIDCSDFTQWHYFSFSQNKIIAASTADSSIDKQMAGRDDWDIAFHRENVRTNSGTSGNNKPGGILESKELVFENLTTAPEDGYEEDGRIEILTKDIFPTGPESYTQSVGSKITEGWASRKASSDIWTIAQKVFVIKTNKGNYAKIYLKGFVANGKSGFVTMQYFYQSEVGNRTLQK